jgi:hypothetical protein
VADVARVSQQFGIVSTEPDPGEGFVSQQFVNVTTAPDPATAIVTQQYIIVAIANNFVPPPPPVAISPAAVGARRGAFYMDSTLEYDGRNVGAVDGLFPGVVLNLTGGTTWQPGETLTVTASLGIFTADDVGNVLVLHAADDTKVRFAITGFVSATVVTGIVDVAVPADLQDATVATWDRAVDQVAGVDHLEGEYLAIMGDDHVVGSPYNPAIALRQVVSGVVDLGDNYTHIFVGLPYVSDLETLDIDTPSGPSVKQQQVDVTTVGLMLLQSRSTFVGGRPPSDDSVDLLEDLLEMPLPTDADYETLATGYRDIVIPSAWDKRGHVFVRSVDPTPVTVLAAIPNGHFPQT